MTLVELMIGMMMTAIIIGALGAFMTAMANGWRYNGQSQYGFAIAQQAELRMQRLIKGAALLGASGPSGILIWVKDDNRDNQIQFSELGLIEHNTMSDPKTVTLLRSKSPETLTGIEKAKADTVYTWAYLSSGTSRADFKTQVSGMSQSTILAVRVSRTNFVAVHGQVPRLQFEMNIVDSDGDEIDLIGTASVRAANLTPAGL